MAISRGTIVLCLITLMVCSFLVKTSKADDCNRANPGDSKHCVDIPEEEDDFDDTYKVVNNMKVSSEMIILGR
ncbi:hypothetical protein PTKIN_Ptkin12aG0070300 [Pterospermum kingtungense]